MAIPLKASALSELIDPPRVRRRGGTVTVQSVDGVEYRLHDSRRLPDHRCYRVHLGSEDATHRVFLARQPIGERTRLHYDLTTAEDHSLDEPTVVHQLAHASPVHVDGGFHRRPGSRSSSEGTD